MHPLGKGSPLPFFISAIGGRELMLHSFEKVGMGPLDSTQFRHMPTHTSTISKSHNIS